MAKLLDKILVIDLEATCWEGYPPKGQRQEIIEIGTTLLDLKTLNREEKASWFVRPQFSDISPFCTKLTTITQKDVDSGISLRESCDLLENKFNSKNRTWASFGDFDRSLFDRECSYKRIRYPLGTHLNIKNLFAIVNGFDREIGMEQSLHSLQQSLEGTHHRAGDDAWNIAFILADILKKVRGEN